MQYVHKCISTFKQNVMIIVLTDYNTNRFFLDVQFNHDQSTQIDRLISVVSTQYRHLVCLSKD